MRDRCMMYTLPETAEILGMSKSTLYKQSAQGRLNPELGAIRTGRTTRFPRRVIDRLAEGGFNVA